MLGLYRRPTTGEFAMNPEQNLELQALERAKTYMGDFAWPTVGLGFAVFAGYLATPALVVAGYLPLPPAVALMALLTYLAYTVLHEAAHGSISGSHNRLRWLNELMGYLAAWMIMLPLTAHRHEHLAHHRHTNNPEQDPDFIVARFRQVPWRAWELVFRLTWQQFAVYLRLRRYRGARRQDLYLCLEVLAAVVPRVAFCAAGFWVEGLALFAVAWIIGVTALLYLFAYIVHTPHEVQGRFVDTSTILVPKGVFGKLITLAWVYQNYHAIHHLYPRVPFYRYPALFADIEGTMVAHGAPIYRLGWRGLERGEVGPTTPALS
jgi:beta-carotene hydroxylase